MRSRLTNLRPSRLGEPEGGTRGPADLHSLSPISSGEGSPHVCVYRVGRSESLVGSEKLQRLAHHLIDTTALVNHLIDSDFSRHNLGSCHVGDVMAALLHTV